MLYQVSEPDARHAVPFIPTTYSFNRWKPVPLAQCICWHSSWGPRETRHQVSEGVWSSVFEIPSSYLLFSVHLLHFQVLAIQLSLLHKCMVSRKWPCLSFVFTCCLFNIAVRPNQKLFVQSPDSLKLNLIGSTWARCLLLIWSIWTSGAGSCGSEVAAENVVLWTWYG